MWRPERGQTPAGGEQARQLEALDRALAGGPDAEPGGEHAGLVALVLAVREDRPPLRPAFVAELDRRAADGFPRRAPARAGGRGAPAAGSRRRPRARHWLAGLGLVTAVAMASVVVAGRLAPAPPRSATTQPGIQALAPPPSGSSTGAAGTSAPPAGASPGPAGSPEATAGVAGSGATGATAATRAAGSGGAGTTPATGAAGGAAPVPASPITASPPAVGGRAVQRDASLGLLAPRGHVQQVTDRAIAAADRLGGIVESSNVALDDQGGSQASLELRVPSAALARTLAALSALAHVSSRTENALDITDPTAAARDQLAESRAERDALLRQLAKATNPNQVASLHARLGIIDGRIVQDQARLQSLVNRATFAQVSLTIGEDPAGAGAGAAGRATGWGPGAALQDALTVLEAVFSVLVVALAGLVPAALLGGLAWWASRPLRRRRREGVLTAAG